VATSVCPCCADPETAGGDVFTGPEPPACASPAAAAPIATTTSTAAVNTVFFSDPRTRSTSLASLPGYADAVIRQLGAVIRSLEKEKISASRRSGRDSEIPPVGIVVLKP
jgi:hypothetical protein